MFDPNADNASPMVGPEPPDRTQMTLEDHCNAILDYLRDAVQNQSISPQDMMTLRAFEEGKQATLTEALGTEQPGTTPSVASMNGDERAYGTSADDTAMPAQVGGQ